MFDIDGFIADCIAARARPDYLAALRERLLTAISRPADIASAFAADQGEETLVYAGDALTVVHVRLSPNVLFPPHNHHMEALIGAYQGGEVHRRYLRRGAGLVETGETALAAGCVGHCDVRDIHAVANPSSHRTAALHVYCGDLVGTMRQIWRPDLNGAVAYSDERYFEWALPYDPSQPFVRPETCNAHAVSAAGSSAGAARVTAPSSKPLH